MGRAQVCPSSAARGRAERPSFPSSVSMLCLAWAVAPISQPHIYLVLKALGSERPVLGWHVRFLSCNCGACQPGDTSSTL